MPSAPEWVAQCNCSLCRKTGSLMAYYDRGEASVSGATTPYLTGDKFIETRHCPSCGCITHWDPAADLADKGLSEKDVAFLERRIGINARLLDGFAVTEAGPTFDGAPLEVRFHDNAG